MTTEHETDAGKSPLNPPSASEQLLAASLAVASERLASFAGHPLRRSTDWPPVMTEAEAREHAAEVLVGMPKLVAEADPHGIDQHAPGSKLDAGKMMPWLCIAGFAHALAAVADVTTKGAIKYTPNGWQSVPDGETRYMEAFGRHMLALGRGENIDADTGCLHKAQMIWNLLASLELELRRDNGWSRPAIDVKGT